MERNQISVKNQSAVSFSADALILPIPGDRLEESKHLEALFRAAGSTVQSDVAGDLPLRPGNVSVTSGGNLAYERIVHAPVQSAPDVPTTEENLQVGLRSGLVTADESGTNSVALADPVPPDQQEAMDLDSVAATLVKDLGQYPPANFTRLTILIEDAEWFERLEAELDSI